MGLNRQGRQKPPRLAVGAVGALRVPVVVIVDLPVGGRDFGDGVDAVANVGPVGVPVVRLGEKAADADDGQRRSSLEECGFASSVVHQRYSLICAISSGSSCMALRARSIPWQRRKLARVSCCRAVQNVEGHRDDLAPGGGLQEGAGHPFVEGAHGGAAPDLVVDACGLSAPSLAQWAAWPRYQRKTSAMRCLGSRVGALDLARVPLAESRRGSRCQISASGAWKKVFSSFSRSCCGISSMLPKAAVQLVELGGPHREHGAALQDLHRYAHLEHVGSGGHGDVGLARLSQHCAHRRRRCPIPGRPGAPNRS